MKKILVFTSSMIDSDFIKYQENAKKKANPSNQNFYSRLIRALAQFNEVSVISHRPISTEMFDEHHFDSTTSISNNVKYYYTHVSTNAFYKLMLECQSICHTANKCIDEMHTNDFVIIVDVLRYNLLRAAKKIASKYHVPIIGMLTDNPTNISGVTSKYINSVITHALDLNGYLALSDGLLKVFNNYNQPSYIFEGLVESTETTKKDPLGEYLFFGGALYERYGVKTMIDAYLASNIDKKLVICGSGPLEEYIYSIERKDSRILYLSQLDRKRIMSLQQHALANINPRPINEALDRESVPSKLLEYFSSGVPTLSTKHMKLYDLFKDDALWFEDGSFESLVNGFNRFHEYDYSTLKKMASTAKVKVFELYDLRVQGEAITHFVDSLRVSENK